MRTAVLRKVLRRPAQQCQQRTKPDHERSTDPVQPYETLRVHDQEPQARADQGVDCNGDEFQHQERRAEDGKVEGVVRTVHELREKCGEDEDGLGVARRHVKLLLAVRQEQVRPVLPSGLLRDNQGLLRRLRAQQFDPDPHEIRRAAELQYCEQGFRREQ